MASYPEELRSFDSERCNIVVLGKAGSGKSTVANKILCHRGFEVQFTLKSVTGAVSSAERALKGPEDTYYSVKVVDTLGFMNPCNTHEEILKDIKEFFRKNVVEGVSLVLYVVRQGRITVEDFEMIEIIKTNFHDISPMSAIVITHCEGLESDARESIVREFSSSKSFSHIAKFMKKGIYTVGFPDTSKMKKEWKSLYDNDMEADVQALHKLIYKSTEMRLTSKMFFEEQMWAKVEDTQTSKPDCSVM